MRLIVLHQQDQKGDITCWFPLFFPSPPIPPPPFIISILLKRCPLGNYVPIAIWSGAEPSIAVVCACLPSLRPLFVRLVWGDTCRPKTPYKPYTPSRPLSRPGLSVWRSGQKEKKAYGGYGDGSFNRLNEAALLDGARSESRGGSSWNNNTVDVYGGRKEGDAASEEYELSGDGSRFVTPKNRIRAKTTVVLTISNRVDYLDDLF